MNARANIDLSEQHDAIRTPELTLWRAVIEQHLRDAVSSNVADWQIRRDAREWFAQRGTSFRYVCSLAGFDPDDLSECALAMFERHDRKKGKTGAQSPDAAPPQPRSNTKRYTHDGKTLTLSEWSAETGICIKTLQSRIYTARWPIERALTYRSRKQRSQHSQVPGVGPDLQTDVGTGGGSRPQSRS